VNVSDESNLTLSKIGDKDEETTVITLRMAIVIII